MHRRTRTTTSLILLGALYHVHSFAPLSQQTIPRLAESIESSSRLFALASPPAEDEKHKRKKDSNNSDEDDWTPTRGGFLPNLTKRRNQVIKNVVTIEDYKTIVADERETMVVVRFFAPWCRACKAVEPLYKQLAHEYSPSIKFVQVPLTKHNAYLHEGLGVPKLPYGHVYHPDVGLVEEMSMNKKTFHEFRHTLETYIDGSCDLPAEEENDEGVLQ